MSIATHDLEVEKGSKHSDTSSDETERRPPEKPKGDNAAVGRSYECTFCKRGFTNAQALGGHMNIHRKDKLKAKQKSNPQGSSPSPKSKNSHQVFTSSRYFTQIPSDQQRFPPSPRAQHLNYPCCPSYQQVVHPKDHDSKPGNLGLHGDFMEANLTLGIDPQHMEEDGEESKEDVENNEVDLELRLGHYKYS